MEKNKLAHNILLSNSKKATELWELLKRVSQLVDEKENHLQFEEIDDDMRSLKREIKSLKRENEHLKRENDQLLIKLRNSENNIKTKDESLSFENVEEYTFKVGDSANSSTLRQGPNQIHHKNVLVLSQAKKDLVHNISEEENSTKKQIFKEFASDYYDNEQEDSDATNISPLKRKDDEDSNATNVSPIKRRTLISSSQLGSPINDIIIEDSQDLELTKESKLTYQAISKIEKVDLTKNPVKNNRDWFPEDFIPNPIFKDMPIYPTNPEKIEPNVRKHLEYQKKYLDFLAINNFKKLSNDKKLENHFENKNGCNETITPEQNPDCNYNDSRISPIFKYDITEENLLKYLSIYPNLLTTKKIRYYPFSDSPPGYNRSFFPTTQEVLLDKRTALKNTKIVGLKRLFQSCFIVENGKQIGSWIFKDKELNEKVENGEFLINLNIFNKSIC